VVERVRRSPRGSGGVGRGGELHEEGGDPLAEPRQRGAELAREVEGRARRRRAREGGRLHGLPGLDLEPEERPHPRVVGRRGAARGRRRARCGDGVLEHARLARRVLDARTRAALRLGHERLELEPLAQRRGERRERGGAWRRAGRPQALRAEPRERPVGLPRREPVVEARGQLRAVGAHPPGLAVAGERAEHPSARHRREPAGRLDRVAHHGVHLAACEEPRHRGVVGERLQPRVREAAARDALEVPAGVHAEAERVAARRERVERDLVSAHDHHRARLREGAREAAEHAPLRPHRDSAERHVVAAGAQAGGELGPAEAHPLDTQAALGSEAAHELDVEAREPVRRAGVGLRERSVVAARPDPQHGVRSRRERARGGRAAAAGGECQDEQRAGVPGDAGRTC
jgi:hypothetical protein